VAKFFDKHQDEAGGGWLSTHHPRSSWFSDRIGWPLRDAAPDILEKFWKERGEGWTTPDPTEPQWKPAGPFNIAGRVTSLLVHPSDPQVVYAGAACGGVWQSRNGGEHWESSWPKWASPNIGAMAFDPRDPNTIYCATGEANLSAETYAGNGLYRSTDAGATWTVLAGAAENGLPRRIGVFAVHPYLGEGKLMYLGGVTHDETMPAALYESADGGATWNSEIFFANRSYWCHSIAFHPDGLLFATIEARGTVSGIWRKDANGWRQLTAGLPAPDRIGRVSLAVAPKNPDILYAVVGDWQDKSLLGVYRSQNRGVSWDLIGPHSLPEFKGERFMSYNNAIGVHPEDPNFVMWGGIDLYSWNGKKWERASQWNDATKPDYSHADHHAIVMPLGDLIYAACDGGISVSKDRGQTWSTRVQGMNTTMFYALDVAPRNSRIFGGGCQDNGTLLTGLDGLKEGEFQRVIEGDGAWMVFDPTDEQHVIGTAEGITLRRHSPSRLANWSKWEQIDLPASELFPGETQQTVFAVLAIDRTRTPGAKGIWTGSNRVWHSHNYGGTWKAKSRVLDGSVITAIEVAPKNPQIVFIGTTNGSIFRSKDGGDHWSGNIAGPDIPRRLISQIRTHPASDQDLVVTVAGTGMVARLTDHVHAKPSVVSPAEDTFISHVFYSKDGGDNWRAMDHPYMPDVAFHAAVIEPQPPYRLFVACDCGVWMREDIRDRDGKWGDLSASLPSVIVTGLVFHEDDQYLFASTYGRGIWRLKLEGKLAANACRK